MSCLSFFKRPSKPSCSCEHAAEPAPTPVKSPLTSSIYYDPSNPPAVGFTAPCCSFSTLPAYSPTSPSSDAPLSGATKAAAKDIEFSLHSLDGELRKLSLEMHGTPEIIWEEKKTHDLFVRFFSSQKGWKITPHAYSIKTAFEAIFTHGEGGRTIGYQSELDALPGIGHACGHNLIAISGVGAALSTASALVKHDIPGTVVLLGTPAEEGGGGKLKLLDAGAYKSMSACLMVHPAPQSGTGSMLAVQPVKVTYKGQTAHAGAAPWEGVNALDAAVLAYTSISALRQQMHPSNRVHGIIIGSNWAPNVIPGESSLLYNVRSPTIKGLKEFREKVQKCFEAAALATGCTGTYDWQPAYADVRNTPLLSQTYAAVLKHRYGLEVPNDDFMASTDFGNVTYALPAMHAEYAIHLDDPRTQGNHTVGFTKAAKTKEAHQRTIEAALGIAVTGIRVLIEEEYAQAIKTQWEEWRKGAEGP